MRSSLIDAGPVIALFDNSDQYYLKMVNFLKKYEGRLISTWPVLTEVCYMLDFNTKTQLDFLDWVRNGGIDAHNLGQWQIGGIREKMDTYADLPADFADTSLLEVAEARNLETIITIDRNFSVYRLSNGKRLKSLFLRKIE